MIEAREIVLLILSIVAWYLVKWVANSQGLTVKQLMGLED